MIESQSAKQIHMPHVAIAQSAWCMIKAMLNCTHCINGRKCDKEAVAQQMSWLLAQAYITRKKRNTDVSKPIYTFGLFFSPHITNMFHSFLLAGVFGDKDKHCVNAIFSSFSQICTRFLFSIHILASGEMYLVDSKTVKLFYSFYSCLFFDLPRKMIVCM